MGLKTTLKSLIIKYNYIGWRVVQIRKKLKHLSSKKPLIVNRGGIYRIIKKGRGSNNHVIIEDGCYLDNVVIHMIGNNNTIKFGNYLTFTFINSSHR